MVNLKSIVFAGGCFWGVQAYFNQMEGVKFTEVGYANGKTIDPSYDEVSQGSGHVEAVAVCFDSNILPTRHLIKRYFEILENSKLYKDKTRKHQYQAAIFWQNNAQEELIKKEVEKYYDQTENPIDLDLSPLRNFYRAEDKHQNYLSKNPDQDCFIPKELFEKEIPAP